MPSHQFLLAVVGTLDDVLSAIALAIHLRERGHQPVLLANDHFSGIAAAHEIPFESIGQAEGFRNMVDDPNFWDPVKNFPTLLRAGIAPAVVPAFLTIRRRVAGYMGRSVIVGFNYAFGAFFARRSLEVPLAQIFVQPAMLFAYAKVETADDLRFSRLVRQTETVLAQLSRAAIATGASRAELTALTSAARRGPVPPELFIVLAPEWAMARRAIWPAKTHFTGFSLYDAADRHPLPPEIEAFAQQGPAPVLGYFGPDRQASAEVHQTLEAACRAAGERLIIISGTGRTVSTSDVVLRAPYTPLSALLPHAKAIVHNAGIGATAHAFASGTPQIAITSTFLTPENASVVARLGVGDSLPVSAVTRHRLADLITLVANADDISRAAEHQKQQLEADNDFSAAVDHLEILAER